MKNWKKYLIKIVSVAVLLLATNNCITFNSKFIHGDPKSPCDSTTIYYDKEICDQWKSKYPKEYQKYEKRKQKLQEKMQEKSK